MFYIHLNMDTILYSSIGSLLIISIFPVDVCNSSRGTLHFSIGGLSPPPGCRKLRRWYFGDEISLLGEIVSNSQ